MNKEQWRRAYEPAPESFRYAVQAALKTKEEKTMKKAISRTAVLAIALCLIMSTALAAGIGLLDFLHTNDTGEIQVTKPQTVAVTADKVQIDVREAICDGMAAHVVAAFKLEGVKLVSDRHWETIAEDEKEHTVMFQEGYMVQVNGENLYSYGFDYLYESDDTIVVDYLIDLRKMKQEIPQELELTLDMRMLDTNWETLEKCSFAVQVPVQKDNWTTYEAVNLPIEQNNYRVTSAQVVRTDIGCYLTMELQDTVPAEEMEPYAEDRAEMVRRYPLQGQFWMKALDENGKEYKLLYSQGRHLNESDVETIVHLLDETTYQRFEVGETLTLQPVCEGYGSELLPIILKLQAK